MREEKFLSLTEELKKRTDNAEEIASALRELYSIYSTDICSWLGSLFDPDIGGFYYSNSAKQTHGFLPDIESTNQVLIMLKNLGMIDSYESIPEWVRSKIERYICYLQDPENGLFYHLQWDKAVSELSPSRLARDYTGANNIAYMLGFTVPYSHRELISKDRKKRVPPHVLSKDNFLRYLNSFDWKNDAYRPASSLASQYNLIEEQYLLEVLFDFLDSIQNAKTGLFESRDNPGVLDSYSAISHIYMVAKRPLKYVDRAIPAVFAMLDSDAKANADTLRHTWTSVKHIISILKESDTNLGQNTVERVLRESYRVAPKAILKTKEVLLDFLKSDNTFSYNQFSNASVSQGMPVAIPGVNEGDVNATYLFTAGMTRTIFSALDIMEHYVPIFCHDDYEKFLAALPHPKEGF